MNYCAFCDNELPGRSGALVTITYGDRAWSFGYCHGCADRFSVSWDHAAIQSRRTWREMLQLAAERIGV